MIPTDELRELLAKVTPGPWIADDFCEEDGRQVRVGTNDGTPEYYHRTAAVAYCQTNHDDDRWHDVPLIGQVNAEANARLIALAPFLATEVLRLREMVEESLYHLRLDEAAKGYHERALATLTQADERESGAA